MRKRSCSVDDCENPSRSLQMCLMHYTRFLRTGTTDKLPPRDQGRGPTHHNWRGDSVTYIGAHCRVKRQRGSARRHNCVDCGNQAVDWSYDHNDDGELIDARGYAYSTDPAHYDPRCKSCHIRFDNGNAIRTA